MRHGGEALVGFVGIESGRVELCAVVEAKPARDRARPGEQLFQRCLAERLVAPPQGDIDHRACLFGVQSAAACTVPVTTAAPPGAVVPGRPAVAVGAAHPARRRRPPGAPRHVTTRLGILQPGAGVVQRCRHTSIREWCAATTGPESANGEDRVG